MIQPLTTVTHQRPSAIHSQTSLLSTTKGATINCLHKQNDLKYS